MMTDASKPATKKCEFCDKRGLPLLLVRNAIAAVGSGAPLASALEIELDARAAHYTKRLLRSGYVNVYDEARKRWESYFVTPEQYFFKISETPGVVPVLPAKPFNCPDQGHAAIASCVMVSDPKNASIVWIGFSDVLWTAAVRERNEDAAYRKRHMVGIDVKAALAGGMVPHTRPITQVSAVVAEYAMDRIKGAKAFVWNQGRFAPRQTSTARLIAECEAIQPGKALIVTVPDPVGLAQELALLMVRNVKVFNQNPERRRHLAANASITAIEAGVRDNTKLRESAAAQQLANRQAKDGSLWLLFSEKAREKNEELKTTTPEEASRAADNEWKKYTAKFDESARRKWQASYTKELATYDEHSIAPLARSHAMFMKSREMADYFACNYDTANPDSGVVYTSVFTHCALGTQDKKACTDLYQEWMEGDIADTRNLLLQAMVFNQETVAKAVAKAVSASLDFRSIPWDNLLATYGLAVERLAQNARETAANLLIVLAGPIARMLGKVIDGKVGVRGALMALGIISGHPIYRIEMTDNRINVRRMVAKKLIERSGLPLDAKKMSAAVSAQLDLQNLNGVKMNGNTKATFLISIDDKFKVPLVLSPEGQYDFVASKIRNVNALEELDLLRFRTHFNGGARLAVVTNLIQLVCLWKLIDEEKKALANNKFDAQMRLYSGLAAIPATTGDVIGNAWSGSLTSKYGAAHGYKAATRLLVAAKVLGTIAGIVVAIMDFKQAEKAFDENQSALGGWYIVSGGLGILMSGLLFCAYGSIPIIGILFICIIGVALVIENSKDNPVQDWLERCIWGRMQGARYCDEATEQREFQLTIKD